MNWVTGFHAVEEALTAGRPLDRVLIARGRHGERVEAIVQLAKSRGVPVRFEDRQQIDRAVGTREHQGVAALGASKPTADFEDLLRQNTGHGLIVLLGWRRRSAQSGSHRADVAGCGCRGHRDSGAPRRGI